MLAVLTYKDGTTKNIEVPTPAPATFQMPVPFDINKIGLAPEESDEGKLIAVKPDVIRFVLAGWESGIAEYFEEGLTDAPSAYYEKEKSYLKNKEVMEDVVRQFQKDYPDCKQYENEISELGCKMSPHEGEDPYIFLKRVYDTYMEYIRTSRIEHAQKVAAQQQAAAHQQALQAQDQANDAKEMLHQLQQQYSGMVNSYESKMGVYATNAGPTTFGYEEDYANMQPGKIVQAEMPDPSPKKEISEVELPRSRMIKLKKKEKE